MKTKGGRLSRLAVVASAAALLYVAAFLPLPQAGVAKAPAPKITLKNVQENGCKEFEITDEDSILQAQVVDVHAKDSGNVKKPEIQPAIDPKVTEKELDPLRATTTYTFSYAKDNPKTATLKICPFKENQSEVSFGLSAVDVDGDATATFSVQEKRVKQVGGEFEATFVVPKPFPDKEEDQKKLCDAVRKSLQTKNLEIDPAKDVTCERSTGGATQVKEKGKVPDPKLFGTAALLLDPPVETFLLVVEVIPLRDLTVTKALKPGQPTPQDGGTIAYVIKVRNTGPAPTPAGIDNMIRDWPQGNFVSWTANSGVCSWNGTFVECKRGRLASGEEWWIEIKVRLPVPCTQVTNSVVVDPLDRIEEADETNNSVSRTDGC